MLKNINKEEFDIRRTVFSHELRIKRLMSSKPVIIPK